MGPHGGERDVSGDPACVDGSRGDVRDQEARPGGGGDQPAALRVAPLRTEGADELRVSIEIEDRAGSDHRVARLLDCIESGV